MKKEIQLDDIVGFLEILKEYNVMMINGLSRKPNEVDVINLCGRFSILNVKIENFINYSFQVGDIEKSMIEVAELLNEIKALLEDTKNMNVHQSLTNKVNELMTDINSKKII